MKEFIKNKANIVRTIDNNIVRKHVQQQPLQKKVLNPGTGKTVDETEFVRIAGNKLAPMDKRKNILLRTLISSETIYTVQEAITRINGDHFVLGAPSTDPQGKDQYFKITELGFPRLPGKIKPHEQPTIPGKTNEEIVGSAVRGTPVRKNLHYCDLSKDRIQLEEGHIYLWVQKPDGRIIVGDEQGGLGHPTLGLDTKSPESETGVAGLGSIGGELRKQSGQLLVDNRSGRYGGKREQINMEPVRATFEHTFRLPVKIEFIRK